MRIEGRHSVAASRQRVWDALHDPAVLVAVLPGCEKLHQAAPDHFEVQLRVGVASVKATYRGTVELADVEAPAGYRMHATGSATAGQVQADVEVWLDEDGERTTVRYDADVVIAGALAGVGQRVIAAAATRTATAFFSAVEQQLAERPAADLSPSPAEDVQRPQDPRSTPGTAAAANHAEVTSAPTSTVQHAQQAPPAGRGRGLAAGAVTGGIVALAGVVAGRLLGRRSRSRR